MVSSDSLGSTEPSTSISAISSNEYQTLGSRSVGSGQKSPLSRRRAFSMSDACHTNQKDIATFHTGAQQLKYWSAAAQGRCMGWEDVLLFCSCLIISVVKQTCMIQRSCRYNWWPHWQPFPESTSSHRCHSVIRRVGQSRIRIHNHRAAAHDWQSRITGHPHKLEAAQSPLTT